MPTGHAGDNLPGDGSHHVPGGNIGDTLPGGHADDLGHGPSTSHEPPIGGSHGDGPGGPHDHTSPHHDGHAPGNHTDDAVHQGSRDGHDAHDPGSDGHNSEGATPHDHSGDSTHPSERDVREPGARLRRTSLGGLRNRSDSEMNHSHPRAQARSSSVSYRRVECSEIQTV